MNKKSLGLGIFILVILSFFLIKNNSFTIPKVFETPFRTAVEQEYRLNFQKYGIVVNSHNFWRTPLNNITPEQVLQDKAKGLYQEYKMLEREAKKYSQKVRLIDVKKADWQEVSDAMATNRQLIKNAWTNQLSEQEIYAYYQQNINRFSKQADIKGVLSFWVNGIEQWNKTIEISSENVRKITESYPELEMYLMDIQQAEQKNWKKDNGIYNFLCLEKGELQPLPFNEIIEAVASQLVDEKIDNWLKENMKS